MTTTHDSDVLQWRSWCRLCANTDIQDNVDILVKKELQHNQQLCESIDRHFGVKITAADNLSTQLCQECFGLVSSLIEFKERVLKVQQLLFLLQSGELRQPQQVYEMRQKLGLLDVQQNSEPSIKSQIHEVIYVQQMQQSPLKMRIKKEKNLDVEETEEYVLSDVAVKESLNNHVHSSDPFQNGLDAAALDSNENAGEMQQDNFEPFEDNYFSNDEANDSDNENPLSNAIKTEILNIKTEVTDDAKSVAAATTKNRKETKHNEAEDESTMKYACSECPRKFKRVHHFRKHMQRMHDTCPNIELKCPDCDKTFISLYYLERHVKVHLPMWQKKVVPCPYCEKKFTNNSIAQYHINFVHMDMRPFICEECGVAVRTKANLKEHMLTHSDYAPFECEVCKKAFKNQVRLKNHMEIHDPTKHICSECGLQLNSRTTLNRHLLVHSDEMQHKCDYCGRAFKRAKALKSHLILHTGLKPYSCEFCHRTFANGSNCRSHKKKSHPEELAALEAAGGSKTYTKNIPKLQALKLVTKNADNLAPVVSKQSGRFAFGKKPKPASTINNKQTSEPKADRVNCSSNLPTAATSSMLPEVNKFETNTSNGIPNIETIYTHIMQAQNSASSSSTVSNAAAAEANDISVIINSTASDFSIQIKEPLSQSSAAGLSLEQEASSQLLLNHSLSNHSDSVYSQPQQPTNIAANSQDVIMHSPSSQASSLPEQPKQQQLENSSSEEFYNSIRQNMPASYL